LALLQPLYANRADSNLLGFQMNNTTESTAKFMLTDAHYFGKRFFGNFTVNLLKDVIKNYSDSGFL